MGTFKCGKGILFISIIFLCAAMACVVNSELEQFHHLRERVGKRLGLPKEVAETIGLPRSTESTSQAPSAVAVNAFEKTPPAAAPTTKRSSVMMLDLVAQLQGNSTVPSTDSTSTSTTTTQATFTTKADFGWFQDGAATPGRTAMCVAGGMRSFPYPKIHQSILELKKKINATVFMVMHETTSPGVEKYVQVPFKVDQTALKAALDLMEPVHTEIHNASTCQSFSTVEPETNCCDDAWMSNYLQFGWVWHCLNVVRQYEQKQQMRFEFFVRVRPDVMYFALDQLPSKEKLRKSGVTLTMKHDRNQPADWIFILTRRSLDWFLDTMEDVQNHCNKKHSCRKEGQGGKCLEKDTVFMAPEYSGWYKQDLRSPLAFLRGTKRWTFDTVNLQPVIVRSKGMADCFRLIGDRKRCLDFTMKGWDKVRRLARTRLRRSFQESTREWLPAAPKSIGLEKMPCRKGF
eukprot:s1188_g9.t1